MFKDILNDGKQIETLSLFSNKIKTFVGKLQYYDTLESQSTLFHKADCLKTNV